MHMVKARKIVHMTTTLYQTARTIFEREAFEVLGFEVHHPSNLQQVCQLEQRGPHHFSIAGLKSSSHVKLVTGCVWRYQ